jgi:hypothetical protein
MILHNKEEIMHAYRYFSLLIITALIAGCGSGSSGSSDSSDSQSTTTTNDQQASASKQVLGCQAGTDMPSLTGATQMLNGVVSYQFVPISNSPIKLDFDNSERRPIRFARVEAVEAGSCEVVASTQSSTTGAYSFSVPSDIPIRIRVLAASVNTVWDVSVADNTQRGALYAIYGEALSVEEAPTRNLHAATGWNGSRYNSARLAAPFYLLDQAVRMFSTVSDGYSAADFDPLTIFWSPNNSTQTGDDSIGNIGSSKYYPGLNTIYLLGFAGSNTDEFDINVVNHELAHFVVDSLGRSDGLGGQHSLSSYLEPRSAYSEGIASAIAGLVTGENLYIDTGLPSGGGWSFGIDDPADGLARWHADYGWYNEGAITELIYDLFDRNNESLDTFSLPTSVLFEALAAQKNEPAAVTIFSLLKAISQQLPSSQQVDIQNFAAEFGINSNNSSLAIGEFNDTRLNLAEAVLPVFSSLAVNDKVSLCFDRRLREMMPFNKLTSHRMIYFEVDSPLNAELIFGGDLSGSLFNNGDLIRSGDNGRLVLDLAAGQYIIDLYDQSTAGGCFEVGLRE